MPTDSSGGANFEADALKTFKGVRKVIAKEFTDPWGKVNAYFGLALFAVWALIVLKYLAGSLGLVVDLNWIKFEIATSDTGDLIVVVALLLVWVGYWFLCMGAFVELFPYTQRKRDE